jgi:hypothetical protein
MLLLSYFLLTVATTLLLRSTRRPMLNSRKQKYWTLRYGRKCQKLDVVLIATYSGTPNSVSWHHHHIISGSTVLVRALATSHRRYRYLIKIIDRTPLDE